MLNGIRTIILVVFLVGNGKDSSLVQAQDPPGCICYPVTTAAPRPSLPPLSLPPFDYNDPTETPAPPPKPEGVYEGSLKPCSCHCQCTIPGECCIYTWLQGDRCVKHPAGCDKTPYKKPERKFMCPPWHSREEYQQPCMEDAHCPHSYRCCDVQGRHFCVQSYYDK